MGPPDMGYGAEGAGAEIPGGATLHFDVEVVNISDAPPDGGEEGEEHMGGEDGEEPLDSDEHGMDGEEDGEHAEGEHEEAEEGAEGEEGYAEGEEGGTADADNDEVEEAPAQEEM